LERREKTSTDFQAKKVFKKKIKKKKFRKIRGSWGKNLPDEKLTTSKKKKKSEERISLGETSKGPARSKETNVLRTKLNRSVGKRKTKRVRKRGG